MENKPHNGILKFLNDNWKIGAFLTTAIIAWTMLQSNVKANTSEITEVKGVQVELIKSVNSINTNLAEINTSLKFIEKQLK